MIRRIAHVHIGVGCAGDCVKGGVAGGICDSASMGYRRDLIHFTMYHQYRATQFLHIFFAQAKRPDSQDSQDNQRKRSDWPAWQTINLHAAAKRPLKLEIW